MLYYNEHYMKMNTHRLFNRSLDNSRPILCLLADRELLGHTPIKTIQSLIDAGVDIVQFRDKLSPQKERKTMAQQVAIACDDCNVALIINDDPQLALEVNASGVHLGQQDMSVQDARALLGEQMLIGASCYDSLDLAQTALNGGADYISFGAIFPSTTKTDTTGIALAQLKQYVSQVASPVGAIGGITTANVDKVLACRVAMVTVGSGILSQRIPQQAVRDFSALLRQCLK